MRTTRLACLVLALALLGCAWAPAALADEAAPIYDPGQVFFIDLNLSSTEQAKLEVEPGEYVKGTFEMTKSADGTPSGAKVPFISSRNAEIRLKGNVGGSFRKLNEKPGFKIKFKKAEAALGLRKMTLDNMVQDPSMVHETLAYSAFRALPVFLPRGPATPTCASMAKRSVSTSISKTSTASACRASSAPSTMKPSTSMRAKTATTSSPAKQPISK
jgi:hypothetical protein